MSVWRSWNVPYAAGRRRLGHSGAFALGAATSVNLVLHLGPAGTAYPLWHWDRDVLLYQPAGENAFGPSAVAFAVGPDRIAQRVVIEILAAEDAATGTLTRAESGAPR